MLSVALLAAVLVGQVDAPSPHAAPRGFGAALALLPKDPLAFAIVPDMKRVSDDIEECIARMGREETAVLGRPIDQAKAALGITSNLDDKGSLVVALVARPNSAAPATVVLVPTNDAHAFLESNLAHVAEIAPDAYRWGDGPVVFGRALDGHAVLSDEATIAREFQPAKAQSAAAFSRLDARAWTRADRGDIVAWAGPTAMRSILRSPARVEGATGVGIPLGAAAIEQLASELRDGVDEGLLVVDVDPLGLSVRTFTSFKAESELGSLMHGGSDREVALDALPKQPFYWAAAADIQGLGGVKAVESILAKLPGNPSLPAWLASQRDRMTALQFGVFPSKLGIATGGLLNDAALVIETADADSARTAVRDMIMSLAGDAGGVRREPTWTDAKTLKSGEVVDVFEVTETVLPPDATDARPGDVAMQRLFTQIVCGARGFTGFVRTTPKGLLMTFSQRSDVLARALAAQSGESLARDPVLASYREWLIDGADFVTFVGVGQFGRLIDQLSQLVPGGVDGPLPRIPQSAEPVAFALELDKGTAETALVIPTSVLAIGYEQIRASLLGGGNAARKPSTQPARTDGT